MVLNSTAVVPKKEDGVAGGGIRGGGERGYGGGRWGGVKAGGGGGDGGRVETGELQVERGMFRKIEKGGGWRLDERNKNQRRSGREEASGLDGGSESSSSAVFLLTDRGLVLHREAVATWDRVILSGERETETAM